VRSFPIIEEERSLEDNMTSTLTRPPLGREQLDAYHADGFLVLPGFIAWADVEAVLADANELARRTDLIDPSNLRCRFMPHVETGQMLFEVFDPVIDLSPACARLAAGQRLLAALQQIYGEPACLFKDKLIYKPPGARGYGLHQDWIAWTGFPRSFLTVLIALDPADRDNGCTQVFAGVHRRGCLSPADGQYHELDQTDLGDGRCIDLVLQPGDVVLFGCFTPHRSDPNRSNGFRRQLFLSYNARSDGGNQRDEHYAEFHRRIRQRRQEGAADVYFR
jgi:2-aminoethylphosphonate dioxygenase